jgi:hypothetical protein
MQSLGNQYFLILQDVVKDLYYSHLLFEFL